MGIVTWEMHPQWQDGPTVGAGGGSVSSLGCDSGVDWEPGEGAGVGALADIARVKEAACLVPQNPHPQDRRPGEPPGSGSAPGAWPGMWSASLGKDLGSGVRQSWGWTPTLPLTRVVTLGIPGNPCVLPLGRCEQGSELPLRSPAGCP